MAAAIRTAHCCAAASDVAKLLFNFVMIQCIILMANKTAKVVINGPRICMSYKATKSPTRSSIKFCYSGKTVCILFV